MIRPTPEGLRVNVYVTSGEVFGPKLQGHFRPVGGDWLLIRPGGIGVLDVRATMELRRSTGLYDLWWRRGTRTGYSQFMQGKPPARADLRIVPRYHTSHTGYLWLNRLQCVGIGVVDIEHLRVSYDIHSTGITDKRKRPLLQQVTALAYALPSNADGERIRVRFSER